MDSEDVSLINVTKLLECWRMPPSVIASFRDNMVDEACLLHLSSSTIKELIPLVGPRTIFEVRLEEYKAAKDKCVTISAEELHAVQADVSDTTVVSEGIVDVSNASLLAERAPALPPTPQVQVDLPSVRTPATQAVPLPSIPQELPAVPVSSSSDSSGDPPCKRLRVEAAPPRGIPIKSGNDLKAFLTSSPIGKVPLAHYTCHDFLNEIHRNKLADCIINNELCDDVSKKLPKERLAFLANCLVEVFPKEKKESFFRLHKYPNGKSIGKGKLYTKYYNTRRCLMQVGLVACPREECVDDPVSVSDSEVDDDAVKEALQWLENSKFPWDQVTNFWKKTWKVRFGSLSANDASPVAEYTEKYPALKDPLGYTLIRRNKDSGGHRNNNNKKAQFELDFENLHKAASMKLFSEWPKLLKYITEHLTAKDPHFFIGDESDVERTCIVLQKFCSVFPVVTVHRKGPKSQWRPSKKESEEAFFPILKSIGDIQPLLAERRKKLQNFGLTLQPQVVAVEESDPGSRNLQSVQCYVVCENLLYELSTPLKAVDVAFKIFFATNARYPPEAKQVWEFLQLAVYGVKTKYDSPSSAVIRLVNEYKTKQYNSDP